MCITAANDKFRFATTMKWVFLSLLILSVLIYLVSFTFWPLIVANFNFSIEYKRSPKSFAIFACSVHSTTLVYTFYAPILVASWRRVGYETIVYFVGDFTKPNILSHRLNLTRAYLKKLDAQIIDIQCPENYSIKVSQMIRIFSGFLPESIVSDNETIITSDSDLMPLQSKFYTKANYSEGFVYNALCCGFFQRRNRTYRMYPMGHIALPKRTWRDLILESDQRAELLKLNASNPNLNADAKLSFDLIQLYGRHEFSTVFDQKMTKGDSSWYMDQVLCSMLISDYRRKFSNYSLDERGIGQRLDRVAGYGFWNRDKFDEFGDAHLMHDDVLQEANWKIFRKLLHALFNETSEMFNDYYMQFRLS